MYQGLAEDVLRSPQTRGLKGRVQLIFTSPPFALNQKKKYGNVSAEDYADWLADFAQLFKRLLKQNGSLVVELGNAWQKGEPVMSTLALESLLELQKRGEFKLCEQFVCFNPAKLPTPAQWVGVERIRVTDAYTHIWWMAPTSRPKASNRRILRQYSADMRRLLKTGKYNAGKRPSGHDIDAKSFLKRNRGSIPSNVLVFTNTQWRDPYRAYCRRKHLTLHPARMNPKVAEFFIRFLTNKGDIVLDPFAGSNVTGRVAESLGRRWVSIDPVPTYVKGSVARFTEG